MGVVLFNKQYSSLEMGAGGRVVGCSNYKLCSQYFFKEWGERFNTKQYYTWEVFSLALT